MEIVPHSSDQCNQPGVRTAGMLAARGFSFAPAQGKRPALTEWRQCQTCAPDTATINGWIDASALEAGIGVFSGPGGLIALDFDTLETMRAFEQFAPALASVETYRERTPRGGAHWFFLTTGQPPRTRKIDGGELRGAGAWTVIAPSPGYVQTGGSWDALYRLTSDELRLIESFFTLFGPQHDLQTATARSCETTPDALIQQYRRMRQTAGRNDSLFSVATWGRDQGFSQATVETALIDAFAHDAGAPEHQRQTVRTRQAEGIATIASAYSRPARPRVTQTGPTTANVIREAFLRKTSQRDPRTGRRIAAIPGGDTAIRVRDRLLSIGTQPGDVLNPTGAARVMGLQDRRAITHAFDVIAGVMQGLFSTRAPLAPKKDRQRRTRPTCVESGGSRHTSEGENQPKRRRVRWFRMPSDRELADALGLTVTDQQLMIADMPDTTAGALGWRLSLFARFIERKPGRHAGEALARRFGVVKRTIRRYCKLLHRVIRVIPQFDDTPIRSHAAVDAVIDEFHAAGEFLQAWISGEARRFPPLRGLAHRLIRAGHDLIFRRQLENFYVAATEVWA